MAYRRLKAGDAPSDISASAYNEMLRLVEQRQGPASSPGSGSGGAGAYLAASVLNDTGLNLPEFGIIRLDSPGIDPTVNLSNFQRRFVFRGKSPTDHCQFAVLLAPSPNMELRAAILAGVAPVTLDVVHESHDRAAAINNDSVRLRSGFAGNAEILWKESGTGNKQALIRWPVSPSRRVLGTTAAQISPGASGTVNVSAANDLGVPINAGTVTAHLTWMHGDQAITANKEVVVEWFPEQRKWIITGAECE